MHAGIDVEMNTRIDNGMYLGMDFTMDAGTDAGFGCRYRCQNGRIIETGMNTGIVEGMGVKIEMWESTHEYSMDKDIKRESTGN